MGQFGGVHALGYNPAESEPIGDLDEIWSTLDYIVGGWPWLILGAVCAVVTVWEAREQR